MNLAHDRVFSLRGGEYPAARFPIRKTIMQDKVNGLEDSRVASFARQGNRSVVLNGSGEVSGQVCGPGKVNNQLDHGGAGAEGIASTVGCGGQDSD